MIAGHTLFLLCLLCGNPASLPPLDTQIAGCLNRLEKGACEERAGAAEALGYLRAYSASDALLQALQDENAEVRREAAMALAWCGGREEMAPLIAALSDSDWTVRQSAWVSLTNLSGMEWPFDAQAAPALRSAQARVWRDWWESLPPGATPAEVLELLGSPSKNLNLTLKASVTLSTSYKGEPKNLTDGEKDGNFWQSKQVPFPQWCQVDLGGMQQVACVRIAQYGNGFRMTQYAVSLSKNGEDFKEVYRGEEVSDTLLLEFERQEARYLRVTSFDSENPTYPTTFYEVEAFSKAPAEEARNLEIERALRALGSLGGSEAASLVASTLSPYLGRDAGTPSGRHLVQAGLRSLGRLRDPATLPFLIEFLDTPQWARYAADALGDFGGEEAAAALLKAYPRYALSPGYDKPAASPEDDRPGLSPVDRMYESPFAIASALARFSFEKVALRKALRNITPLLLANLPGDFDAALLYDEEAHYHSARYLLDQAGVRDTARAVLFATLDQGSIPDGIIARRMQQAAKRMIADVPHAAAWMPILSTQEDVDQLITLLDHENGWVRINAAKSLMFLGENRAVAPIAALLEASKAEAAYGYNGEFRFYEEQADGTDVDAHDEYNDPSPRWREAFVRALGRLGATDQIPLLSSYLEDERNVLDIHYASAMALYELGSPEALDTLRKVQAHHPAHSVRLVAREALWRRGLTWEEETVPAYTAPRPQGSAGEAPSGLPTAIVFIKGDHEMPNDFQIDPWRQTYSTTDSGPTYRLGHTLYRLELNAPEKEPVALTHFSEGYVADCEVSWDGQRVLFCHRGGADDPWWHLYEIDVDGTGLRQLTSGPYHDVQPAYLPDGRIVFSSSRMGLRDEYHGYLATGLTVMNADASNLHLIALNLGRDNEAAILNDGRIVFSRLELFYSRLKTELTVQAVFPDGTHNVTLYGPERRPFWFQQTAESGEDWWVEVPSRHRVLRLTQPQAFDVDRVLCASTAGLVLLGPGRYRDRIIPHDKTMALTSPFPLGENQILCAATPKHFDAAGKPELKAGDLGLYTVDAESGAMTLIYNDPATADFEARPIRPRPRPPTLAESSPTQQNSYTTRFNCRSVFSTRDARVRERGKLVRVIEGMPITGRHRTHRAKGEQAWRNHTGTLARVLGTTPLSADGSFFVEVPADRFVHFQVLDSDRRVVGNQLVWIYGRPGERRSCVGCHESPDSTPRIQRPGFPQAAKEEPVQCLPKSNEFTYRAKFWNKGVLPDEGEERTRTVRAVNLMGRY